MTDTEKLYDEPISRVHTHISAFVSLLYCETALLLKNAVVSLCQDCVLLDST